MSKSEGLSDYFNQRGIHNRKAEIRPSGCYLIEAIWVTYAHINRKDVVSDVSSIVVKEGEGIESALKRFNRKVETEGILKDLKKHEAFVPWCKRRKVSKRERDRISQNQD